jgi:hypothetical protein
LVRRKIEIVDLAIETIEWQERRRKAGIRGRRREKRRIGKGRRNRRRRKT